MKLITTTIAAALIAVLAALFVYNSPACAQPSMAARLSPDAATALVKDDLETYIDGGQASIGWRMSVVEARKLHEAYEANEVAADRKYSTADIIISGTIASIDKTIGDRPAVRLIARGPYIGPTAFVTPSHEPFLATLAKGQRVSFGCKRIRRILGGVALYDCEPIASYIERMSKGFVQQIPTLARQGDSTAKLLQQRMQ